MYRLLGLMLSVAAGNAVGLYFSQDSMSMSYVVGIIVTSAVTTMILAWACSNPFTLIEDLKKGWRHTFSWVNITDKIMRYKTMSFACFALAGVVGVVAIGNHATDTFSMSTQTWWFMIYALAITLGAGFMFILMSGDIERMKLAPGLVWVSFIFGLLPHPVTFIYVVAYVVAWSYFAPRLLKIETARAP